MRGCRYLILDVLGQGTFGQVVKCQNLKTHEIVAVKVVKNKPAYFQQSMMEVTILELVRRAFVPLSALNPDPPARRSTTNGTRTTNTTCSASKTPSSTTRTSASSSNSSPTTSTSSSSRTRSEVSVRASSASLPPSSWTP